ncbi:MAG: hypothetical protein OXC02_03020 [Rhodobacteraceae bacterium]|nr:hypothetical protein [Paracoccaceae bacterium]
MNKVNISLRNCYGIRQLEYEFDFSKSGNNVYAIYAPNGSMKTSFAQTFKDISNGEHSQDRIFPSRNTIRQVKVETGKDLPNESVLTLPPYDEFFRHSDKTSTLLVNSKLRKEYEDLNTELNKSKEIFLNEMKRQSGSKKSLEIEIALAFTKNSNQDDFFNALERIRSEVSDQEETPFVDVPYDLIFDTKIQELIEAKGVKDQIEFYIVRYNQLLDSSTYFKKGVFEYYNAAQIATTLDKNGFFDANHSVIFNTNEKEKITTKQQLEDLISKEYDEITKDLDLKKKFDAIKKQLERNIPARDLQKYLGQHQSLLPQLANMGLFKENVWKSYIKANESLYYDLLDKYRDIKARRKKIKEEALKEQTSWEKAIELFNQRFIVPFTLEAKNKESVMLESNHMLELGYRFHDGSDQAEVERKDLIKSLSQGEKKALYILNVIFEVEVRRKGNQETLFVIDDIADSFDYKNKYAIIQYLQEISEESIFKQIILTHNFDFFRTLNSRFVNYSNCLMVTKTPTRIELNPASGIKNPFLNDWKNSLFNDGMKRVASISFARNLIEYTKGESDQDYEILTSLLHWNQCSAKITQSDLDIIFLKLFNDKQGNYSNSSEPVIDMIKREADNCLILDSGVNLENKIVLSIAIRLQAEKFMVGRIADPEDIAKINKNQTQKLLKRFVQKFPKEDETIRTLREVALMTPENIHLNAFMYEPIIDMSDESLKSLYQDVTALTSSPNFLNSI